MLEWHKDSIGFDHIDVSDNIAKVSIVGAGMINNPGVAATMFEALFAAGINIHMISTSEIKVSVLVDLVDADRAVRVVHDKFFGENPVKALRKGRSRTSGSGLFSFSESRGREISVAGVGQQRHDHLACVFWPLCQLRGGIQSRTGGDAHQ